MTEIKISAKRVVFTTFAVDALDILLNGAIFIITGSVVMLAELLQGLADFASSGLLLVGLTKSKGRPDQNYPFGRGKEAFFWALLSALVMITLAAGFSFYFGLVRFLDPEPVENINLAYAILGFTTITNGYSFSLSFRRLLGPKDPGRIVEIFMETPLAETKNAFASDLMGMAAAVFGLLALGLYQLTGEIRFDAIGAMAIGVLLALLAATLIRGLRDFLVGRRAPIKVEGKIRKAALAVPQVLEVLDLRTMQIGPDRILVNMEVHIRGRLTTGRIEKLIDEIKKKVQEENPSVHHIQVELETPEPE